MTRRVSSAVAVSDLQEIARRRLPPVIYHFIKAGSSSGQTLEENRAAFQAVKFRPRAAVSTSSRNLGTTLLSSNLALPVVVAPCGGATMVHPAGEPALARAAGAMGTIYVVPHTSGHAMEAVRKATPSPLWYQIYPHGGSEVMEAALDRAGRCDFQALVMTVDTATGAEFEDSVRHGLSSLSAGRYWEALPHLPQFLFKPSWLLAHIRGGYRLELPNLVKPDGRIISFRDMYSGKIPPTPGFSWSDVARLRQRTNVPLIVKGVLTGKDACLAVEAGADAIVVSNHGGRMLDGSMASLRALPEVVEAVRNRAEVVFDGGIRRGTDVVKAICLGARAVLVGRASLYGLGAGGELGVQRALAILRNDIDRTLAFLGCPSIDQLDASYLEMPAHWTRR
ncbi:alpha-hydroxy acid oxidase [Bradyrhizobium sp. 187]|uniref:alpha-hydroxy acid oxidase n=1 Tax=Bradyrhizobium sp. 187 TaxID=2782655 RepID=UPI001FFEF4B8|nr:alpha-hydroxy acid oxidase [Bradyrhizobium sp. 187]UPJ71831.1 alpha-hydroxy-acid oxidizing protein [Bradyrhizobium sp. 187]